MKWNHPTAEEAMQMFRRVPVLPEMVMLQQNSLFPSLGRRVSQHLVAAQSTEVVPKLRAPHDLILQSDANEKFCVVAGNVKSLKEIADFLRVHGVKSVGAGSRSQHSQLLQQKEVDGADPSKTGAAATTGPA